VSRLGDLFEGSKGMVDVVTVVPCTMNPMKMLQYCRKGVYIESAAMPEILAETNPFPVSWWWCQEKRC